MARLFPQFEAKAAWGPCRRRTSLGLNEGTARVAVHRLRKCYRELLRQEIAQTLSEPADLEEELRALFRAFAEQNRGVAECIAHWHR